MRKLFERQVWSNLSGEAASQKIRVFLKSEGSLADADACLFARLSICLSFPCVT